MPSCLRELAVKEQINDIKNDPQENISSLLSTEEILDIPDISLKEFPNEISGIQLEENILVENIVTKEEIVEIKRGFPGRKKKV